MVLTNIPTAHSDIASNFALVRIYPSVATGELREIWQVIGGLYTWNAVSCMVLTICGTAHVFQLPYAMSHADTHLLVARMQWHLFAFIFIISALLCLVKTS